MAWYCWFRSYDSNISVDLKSEVVADNWNGKQGFGQILYCFRQVSIAELRCFMFYSRRFFIDFVNIIYFTFETCNLPLAMTISMISFKVAKIYNLLLPSLISQIGIMDGLFPLQSRNNTLKICNLHTSDVRKNDKHTTIKSMETPMISLWSCLVHAVHQKVGSSETDLTDMLVVGEVPLNMHLYEVSKFVKKPFPKPLVDLL